MRSGLISLVGAAFVGFTPSAHAQPTAAADIKRAAFAPHIAEINEHSVILVAGSTYSFTVDTPADNGLISTGLSANQLAGELQPLGNSAQDYRVADKAGRIKMEGELKTGDTLTVTSGVASKTYQIEVRKLALAGRIELLHGEMTADATRKVTLRFTAGQRSPDASVRIHVPEGIHVTLDNTTVNVIGRGSVRLRDLERQSIGRVGTRYSYAQVGEVRIADSPQRGSLLLFSHLDLRPANGVDLEIVIDDVRLPRVGEYDFQASYTTSRPEELTSASTGGETALLRVVPTISDFERVIDSASESFTAASFRWTPIETSAEIGLMQTTDQGKTWSASTGQIDREHSTARVTGLTPNNRYAFRLQVKDGEQAGASNSAYFFSGKMDVKQFGVAGDGKSDDTDGINAAVAYLAELGGGTLRFGDGVYRVRTVHLRSNVTLFLERGATLKALKHGDPPEATWFSDRKYRRGTSPTARGPYENPENWLTKQDVGHTFFQNAMFTAQRCDNIRIIGTGRLTGDGNLVTTDAVMEQDPDKRSDKMFSFKLCTNVEIGGLRREEDLWYDPQRDAPYYILPEGKKDFACENMLHIDRAGHFALLATGCDGVNVHDTYFARENSSNARDIYDFMQCNDVTVTNVYSKVSSDDLVKLGSDCSLGFTRTASNFRVRNIIGDTNCNVFQIGSETADDIADVHVDNLYVLGANKAGFSISTNDGAHVHDVHLNCGHTGPLHSRSKMLRTNTPFFISISNRGRVLGSQAKRYTFQENGRERSELLSTNVNIGKVENIVLNAVDVAELYSGSSHRDKKKRWKAFDGSQRRATPIVAGYALPRPEAISGGEAVHLPDGRHTGYVENIEFRDVHVLAKGGNPRSDRTLSPPELGVGQYNVSNLKTQPSYGLWVRHAKKLAVSECTFHCEQPDGRYAVFLDDVAGARFRSVAWETISPDSSAVGLNRSKDILLEAITCYHNTGGKTPSQPISVVPSDGNVQPGINGPEEK